MNSPTVAKPPRPVHSDKYSVNEQELPLNFLYSEVVSNCVQPVKNNIIIKIFIK